jgi:hypothetical protein
VMWGGLVDLVVWGLVRSVAGVTSSCLMCMHVCIMWGLVTGVA